MAPNQYLLAADNSPELIPLLRSNPSLASQQDEHGYSLIHAAASYNHLDLLRTLVGELKVPVDLRDEDAETALFVVETVDAARCLVEELKLDPNLRGDEGTTAREKIEAEGDFPLVAEYLRTLEGEGGGSGGGSGAGEDETRVGGSSAPNGTSGTDTNGAPPLPLAVTTTMVDESEIGGEAVDPEFRQRIEQLAARDDFYTAEGQAELRQLVQSAIADAGLADDRNVRPRQG